MKKIVLAAVALVGLLGVAAHAAPGTIFGYVKVSTDTTYAPTLQNGAIKVSSATINNLTVPFGVNAATGVFAGVTTSTITASSATLTNANITGVSGSTMTYSSATITNASITGVTGSTMTYSSATITNANITGVSGSTVTFSSGTITKLSVSTLTVTGIVGTATNDNAAVGNYGQYTSSSAVTINCPTSGNFGDLVSLTLTAGDWDISSNSTLARNGSTWTDYQSCINTTSGNSNAGCTQGDNLNQLSWANSATTPGTAVIAIPSVRASISGTTTYFLKYECTYTAAGPPQAYGRLSARRMR